MRLARDLGAAVGSLVLISAAGCGSSDHHKDGRESQSALPDFPASFHGAHRVAQASGERGKTSVTLRFKTGGGHGAATLVTTRSSEAVETTFAKPVRSAPDVRIVAAAYAAPR